MSTSNRILFVCLHGAARSVLAAAEATHVVAFGCDLSHVAPAGTVIDQWTDVPPMSDDLPTARAVIRRHLDRLLDECAARGRRQ